MEEYLKGYAPPFALNGNAESPTNCVCPLCALEATQREQKLKAKSAESSYLRAKAKETIANRSGGSHHTFQTNYNFPGLSSLGCRPYELLPKIAATRDGVENRGQQRDAWVLPSVGDYNMYDHLEKNDASERERLHRQRHQPREAAPLEGDAARLPGQAKPIEAVAKPCAANTGDAFIVIDGKLKRLAIGPGIDVLTENGKIAASPAAKEQLASPAKPPGDEKPQQGKAQKPKDTTKRRSRAQRKARGRSGSVSSSSSPSSRSSSSSSSSSSSDEKRRRRKHAGKHEKRSKRAKSALKKGHVGDTTKRRHSKHRYRNRSDNDSDGDATSTSSSSHASVSSDENLEKRHGKRDKQSKPHSHSSKKKKTSKHSRKSRAPSGRRPGSSSSSSSSTSSSDDDRKQGRTTTRPERGNAQRKPRPTVPLPLPPPPPQPNTIMAGKRPPMPGGPMMYKVPPYPPQQFYPNMPPNSYPVAQQHQQQQQRQQLQPQPPTSQQRQLNQQTPTMPYPPESTTTTGKPLPAPGLLPPVPTPSPLPNVSVDSGASRNRNHTPIPLPSLPGSTGANRGHTIPVLPYVIRDNAPHILEPAHKFFSNKTDPMSMFSGISSIDGRGPDSDLDDLATTTQTRSERRKVAPGSVKPDDGTVVVEMGSIDEFGHTVQQGKQGKANANASVDDIAGHVLEALARRLDEDESLLRRSGRHDTSSNRSATAPTNAQPLERERSFRDAASGSGQAEPALVAAEEVWRELRRLPDGVAIEDVSPEMRHYFQERFPDTLVHTKKYIAQSGNGRGGVVAPPGGRHSPRPLSHPQGMGGTGGNARSVGCTADPDEIDRECQVAEDTLREYINEELDALRAKQRAAAREEEEAAARRHRQWEDAMNALLREEMSERRAIQDEEADSRDDVEDAQIAEVDELLCAVQEAEAEAAAAEAAAEAAEADRKRQRRQQEKAAAAAAAAAALAAEEKAAEVRRWMEEAAASLSEAEEDSRENVLLQEATDRHRLDGLQRILLDDARRREDEHEEEEEEEEAAREERRGRDAAVPSPTMVGGEDEADESHTSGTSPKRPHKTGSQYSLVRESRLIPNQLIGVVDSSRGGKIRLLGDPHVDAIEERIRERKRQDAARQQRLSEMHEKLRGNSSKGNSSAAGKPRSDSNSSRRLGNPTPTNGRSKYSSRIKAKAAASPPPEKRRSVGFSAKGKVKRERGGSSPSEEHGAATADAGGLDLGLQGMALNARRRSSFALQRGISGGGGGVLYSVPATPKSAAAQPSDASDASDTELTSPRRLSEMMDKYIQKADVGY